MINWEDSEDGHNSRLGNVATIVHENFEDGDGYYLNTQVGDHDGHHDEPFYSLAAAKIAAVEALRPQYDALHAVFGIAPALSTAAAELILVASDACEYLDDDLTSADGPEHYAAKVRVREAIAAVRKALGAP